MGTKKVSGQKIVMPDMQGFRFHPEVLIEGINVLINHMLKTNEENKWELTGFTLVYRDSYVHRDCKELDLNWATLPEFPEQENRQ